MVRVIFGSAPALTEIRAVSRAQHVHQMVGTPVHSAVPAWVSCVSMTECPTAVGFIRWPAEHERNAVLLDTHRQEPLTEVNSLLRDYGEGYELSLEGEILSLGKHGSSTLLQAHLPPYDPENVDKRIATAVLRLRRYRSSLEDRRVAVRDLAEVLEFLRPKLKEILTRNDESDLFNIANNFGIRHRNDRQKTDYDQAIWYNWMFYFYLCTLHATVRLIIRHEEDSRR